MTGKLDIKKLLEDAWAKRRIGEYEEARSLVDQAHSLSGVDDYMALGRIFHIYMQFESDHGKTTKAIALSQKSVGYYKKAKNLDKIAHATRHLASLQADLGLDADAEDNYRRAIEIYRNQPKTHPGDLANALRAFALWLEQGQKIKEAIDVWKETKELYRACNLQAGVDEAVQKLDSLS